MDGERKTSADPTRIVADADVLVADLLVGGPARAAMDLVREHSWLTLVASDPLLAEAERVVSLLADDDLATDWRAHLEALREPVEHPEGDHPGLASAYRGGAAHLLTFDEDLATADVGLSLQPQISLSLRTPDAFCTVFDAEALYEATHEEAYSGPDRDPRA